MHALTLWRPWPAAILYLGKRVENRTWKPPRWLIGQRLAIHAGRRIDTACGFGFPNHLDPERICAFERHRNDEGIVAVVRVVRAVIECPPRQERWWAGPIGWVFDKVERVDPPAPCRGFQGLWPVPDEVWERLVG